MDKLLKQAVKNSKAKRYHGTLDEINELPPSDIQVKNYNQKFPQLEDFFNITSEKGE